MLFGEDVQVEVFQRLRVGAGGLFLEHMADREALDGPDDHARLRRIAALFGPEL